MLKRKYDSHRFKLNVHLIKVLGDWGGGKTITGNEIFDLLSMFVQATTANVTGTAKYRHIEKLAQKFDTDSGKERRK